MESAAVGAILQVMFDRMAPREFTNFFGGRKHEEELLKKLKNKLLAVRPLLNDAEHKQWTDTAVKEWVDELKDVIYHADDLLDEIATEAMLSKLDSDYPTSTSTSTTTTQAISDFVSWSPFGEGVASRIEEIIERLEDFVIAKESLGLREVVGRNNLSHRWPTTSLVDHASVYGRVDDKDKIIQLLISDDDSSGHQVSVIPIVGMGGIGKTTLAQLVYNDPKVDDHFDMKSWVCVSEELDILRVTKSILQGLSLPYSSNDDLNTLQVNLRNGLAGKKFVIFLDDIWNENYNHWDKLRSPFGAGKQGSKIIITTRSDCVASIMRTVPIFHLGQLSNEDCWLLFSKHAFENVSPIVQPNFELIGRKIVEKCKGLPLAIKTLGGLLRYKVEVEWVNVLESHILDLPKDKSDILPALLLSYHHLPSHLKLCFAYCAIIPKAFAFKKDELVRLWIAEGFVQQPITNGRIEEKGDGYFRELISRSFFQQSSDDKFLMHDLINDLAQFVAGKYCLRLADDKRHDISKVRYFSYFKNFKETFDAFSKLKVINKDNCLRTFKLFNNHRTNFLYPLNKKVLHDVLPTLRCLRVLSLSCYDIVEFPDSIGNLIHLRYLDLSSTHIRCLPETISRLCNLETLLLQDCGFLTGLPTYLCKLICLRHLNISGTNLREMPMQIGKLRSLQCLTNFIVGNQTGSAISELRELHHLHGTLSISSLQNVYVVKDALEANLKNKKHLEALYLGWDGKHTNDPQKEREVLEKLQPHTKLKHLTISKYGGTRFPSWLGDHSFVNIISFYLYSCNNCFLLPPLGKLPYLQELTIGGMNMVKNIGYEFYGHVSAGIKPFQSLKKLTFEEMPEWQEWSVLGAGEFYHLTELRIYSCPKLIGEFPKHLPYLKEIDISRCQRLLIENILKLDDHCEIVTDSYPGVVPMQHLFSLQLLQIETISKLQILSLKLCSLTNLDELSILWCSMLNTIQIVGGDHRRHNSQPTEEMKGVNTTLKKISIYDCPQLELPLYEDAKHHYKFLQDLTTISSCDSLKSFPLGFFPNLRSLHIEGCRDIESLLVLDGIQNLTSLQSLWIGFCPNMVSIGGGGLPASNLTSFTIWSCKKLKALPEQMCTLLPSLQSLAMGSLPEIESFPLGGLPSSLNSLTIWHCNKLMARRMEWGLQRLPILRKCEIRGECEEDKLLESFPEECLLPTSLTHLQIKNRPNLKSLNPNGLRHLNSLKSLLIWDCPKLQSLPDEGLPSSLVRLRIWECPLLEVRCQREKGDDWLKISHIPSVYIEHEAIVDEVIDE